MDTKTIDQRIRAKARKELTKEINLRFREFGNSFAVSTYSTEVQIPPDKIDDAGGVRFSDLLYLAEKAALAADIPIYQERAVAAFLEDVERLKTDVDELFDGVGQ